MIVVTAAQNDQVASWDESAKHGLFTKYLLKALQGSADIAGFGNGDGNVTLGELRSYLDDKMTYQARRLWGRDQKASIQGAPNTVLAMLTLPGPDVGNRPGQRPKSASKHNQTKSLPTTRVPIAQSKLEILGIVRGVVSSEAVIDGDTIDLRGRRIRLYGIDAPEKNQHCETAGQSVPCGIVAYHALIGFLMNAEVRCERTGTGRYGRDIGRCYADGYDVSAGLVRAGLAVAYRKYSMDYVPEEDSAKKGERGMWKGTFDMPWDWRARRRQ